MSVPAPGDIRIRPYRVDDAAALQEAVIESLAELQPWMPWSHPGYSFEEARSWIEMQVAEFQQHTAFEFVIETADGRYAGACGLNQIDEINSRANLGYWVRTSATRKGVATRAVCAIRDWAFQHTNLVRLEILVAVGNIASYRVAAKSGATLEGVLKKRLLLFGTHRDATMFSLTRHEPS